MTKHTISYHIWSRALRFADVLLWCREFAAERNIKITADARFELRISRFERIAVGELSEFVKVLQTHPEHESLITNDYLFCETDRERSLAFNFYVQSGVIGVGIASKDVDLLNAAHIALRDRFQLRNPPPPVDAARRKALHATVFLGHHFDDHGLRTAGVIGKFLALLRFEVIEGQPYTSQPIPEKVKAGIARQDIYIGLATGQREHDWIVAESAFASGRDKHIILLVEDDSGFNPTISGKDLEQIRFAVGYPEQCFIRLVEEFRSTGIAGLF